MLKHLHIFLLAALGGVRVVDAVEAAAYERVRPAGRRDELLDYPAHVISLRVDRAVAAGRKSAEAELRRARRTPPPAHDD